MKQYEFDIIAQDETHILFIEVKTRRAIPGIKNPYGRPARSVIGKKSEFLLRGVQIFLHEHKNKYNGLSPRIDVVEIYASPYCENFKPLFLNHIKNAVRKKSVF